MMNLKDIPQILKRFFKNKSESDDEIVAAIVMIVIGILALMGFVTMFLLN